MISVQEAGFLTSIQDLGRPSAQDLGISAGGAMDQTAARWANRLVGNMDGAAVLEVTLKGPRLIVERGCWIALAGSTVAAHIDHTPLPTGSLAWAPEGAEIHIGATTGGCRSYLGVSGGLDIPLVFDSASTLINQHFGGWGGRALEHGDRIPLKTPCLKPPQKADAIWVSPWRIVPAIFREARVTLLALISDNELTEYCMTTLWARHYHMSAQSNRMGIRLAGVPMEVPPFDLRLSAGLAFGSVQLPPDGLPIILGADRQSTGGYPLLGTIATCDHSKVAQLRPGAQIGFIPMTLEAAHQSLWRMQMMENRAHIAVHVQHQQQGLL